MNDGALNDVLALACLLIAIVLVLLEVWATVRPPKVEVTMQSTTADGFPGSSVIEKLAEKSPRVAAALAFMILAGVFNGLIEFTAGTGG